MEQIFKFFVENQSIIFGPYTGLVLAIFAAVFYFNQAEKGITLRIQSLEASLAKCLEQCDHCHEERMELTKEIYEKNASIASMQQEIIRLTQQLLDRA